MMMEDSFFTGLSAIEDVPLAWATHPSAGSQFTSSSVWESMELLFPPARPLSSSTDGANMRMGSSNTAAFQEPLFATASAAQAQHMDSQPRVLPPHSSLFDSRSGLGPMAGLESAPAAAPYMTPLPPSDSASAMDAGSDLDDDDDGDDDDGGSDHDDDASLATSNGGTGDSMSTTETDPRKLRLERNRRAAQQFRKRQKLLVVQLQREIAVHTADSQRLSSEVEREQAEGVRARLELAELQQFLIRHTRLTIDQDARLPAGVLRRLPAAAATPAATVAAAESCGCDRGTRPPVAVAAPRRTGRRLVMPPLPHMAPIVNPHHDCDCEDDCH